MRVSLRRADRVHELQCPARSADGPRKGPSEARGQPVRTRAERSLLVMIVTVLLTLTGAPSLAHPGNTGSDGCHYCRTNCASWGVPQNARHCHGTTRSPTTGGGGTPSRTTGSASSGTSWDPVPWLFWGSVGAYVIYRGTKKPRRE